MSADDAARSLRLDGTGPLYGQIRRAILKRILSGAWPPGYRIPSEHALAERFGSARMTVNRALSKLAEEGLIVRRRRSGSFVAAPPVDRSLLQIHDIATETARAGQRYTYQRLLRRVVDSAPAARALDVPVGTPILRLNSLHRGDGVPVQYEERLINLDTVPEARNESFADRDAGVWLLDHVPWTQAEHTIAATNADETLARLLEIEAGTACLIIERRTWRDGHPITYARFFHPGTARTLVARFSPTRR